MLKVYDLIAFQFEKYCRSRGELLRDNWRNISLKVRQDFNFVCKDIIPRHLLPIDIVALFGPKEEDGEKRRKIRRSQKRWGIHFDDQDGNKGDGS